MGLQDHQPGNTVTRKVNGPVTTPYRFVVPTGTERQVALASAKNAAVYGVIETTTRLDQDPVAIIIDGMPWIESGAAINDGDDLITDSQGRAIPVPAGLQDKANVAGKAYGSASAAGQVVGIKLARSVYTLPTGTKLLSFTGHNGAGACTAVGLKVGDKVASVTGLTTVGDGTAGFESVITVADQIQQSSATDLSAKNFAALVYTG